MFCCYSLLIFVDADFLVENEIRLKQKVKWKSDDSESVQLNSDRNFATKTCSRGTAFGISRGGQKSTLRSMVLA